MDMEINPVAIMTTLPPTDMEPDRGPFKGKGSSRTPPPPVMLHVGEGT